MMQFTETTPPHDLHHHPANGLAAATRMDPADGPSPPWQSLPVAAAKSLVGLGTAGCMEQLLVRCAAAVEANDATLAQQVMWVLNNIASQDGDCNQRLAAAFLRALLLRSTSAGCCAAAPSPSPSDAPLDPADLRFTPVALSTFIDLTPWYRFGYTAANSAIVEATEGLPVVHVVDLSTTHCMQMPTLIDALASRPEGPPLLRLTVPLVDGGLAPPVLDVSYDDLGSRLVNFARSRNVNMEFRAIPSSPSDGFDALIQQVQLHQLTAGGEALIVNCQMLPHRIPDETAGSIASTSAVAVPAPPLVSLRSLFLKSIRALSPLLVTLVDEDVELTSDDVTARLRSAFNYFWIPYDAVDTFLPRGSKRRRQYEAELRWRVENVLASEGVERVERQEGRGRWAARMRAAGFRGVVVGDEVAAEVRAALGEHAAVGWGLRREEEEGEVMVLTWKGHDVVFASTWTPC